MIGAAVMIAGGIIQAIGVEAAGRDLEDIAPPLPATEAELDEPGEEADEYARPRRGPWHRARSAARARSREELLADTPSPHRR